MPNTNIEKTVSSSVTYLLRRLTRSQRVSELGRGQTRSARFPLAPVVLVAAAPALAGAGCDRSLPKAGPASTAASAPAASGKAAMPSRPTDSGAQRGQAASRSAPAGQPVPGAAGLSDGGQMQLSDQDRCPVCAMRVTAHEKFASAIELDSGATYYFCGTGCLLRSWLHPEVFLGVERSRVKRAVVRDYFTGKQIDAAGAVWIAGSDVVGPMGPAIVPLADEQAAETFKRRHGGRHRFRLAELSDEQWKRMTGKQAGR
jgi:nitrous oxide reductase accessory protein NosL